METENKKVSTRTPQELVHIKHTISVRQYKYWFLLLKAYKELLESGADKDEKGFYSVSLANISNLMGYEPVKKELKADLEALRQQPIIINYLEKNGKPVTHGMGFISEWKVTSNQIAFKLPSFIEDVVKGDLEAKQMFLLLNWDIFNSFGGKYEAIIYKLCKDYIGVGRTPYFTIEEYRDYIGLQSDEYASTDDFNKRCLKNPIKNINDNEMADISVEVIFSRKGRKIIGLHFEMKQKITPLLEIAPLEPNPAFEKSLITIPPNKQLEYLKNFSEEQIAVIIDRANAYIDQLKADGKKASIGAIYNKAFAESWGLDNWEAEKRAKAKVEEQKRRAKEQKEAELKAEQEVKEKRLKEREELDRCVKIFETFSVEVQEEILNLIEQETNEFMRKIFIEKRKKGEAHYHLVPPYSFIFVRLVREKQ